MILAILLITIGASIGAFLVKIGLGYLNTYRLLLRSNCFCGPRAFPLLGSAHLFVGRPADVGVKMLDIMKDNLESPFRIWLGMRLYFVVQDPEHVKLVLLNPNALEKDPSIYGLTEPVLGDGLATSPVSLWKPHRKLIEPFFRMTVIESYIALFTRNALLTVKKMAMEELGREFIVHDYISRYSFDNICERSFLLSNRLHRETLMKFDISDAAMEVLASISLNIHSRYYLDYVMFCIKETSMGVNINATHNTACPPFDALHSVEETVIVRALKPWLHPDSIFKCTSTGQKFYKNVTNIRGFVGNILDTMKSELQGGELNKPWRIGTFSHHKRLMKVSTFFAEIETQPKKYLASQLLTLAEDGGTLTDKEIIDHIITTIITGYDTTARLVSGAIFILARYPHIQDNLYAEVREIFGESEVTDITLPNIQRLPYMERLLKETLRFFPALPAVLRRPTKDINLGECTLPAGSSVVLMMMAIHRNEKYWPRALECHPDRFLPGHPLGPRHPYAFIPFSAGPRNCIGMKYGMISAKILLATLVSRYIIKTRIIEEVGDLKLKVDVTMRPKEPFMISLERRLPESS